MSNKMWGGRFGEGPDRIMEEINASIGFDQRFFAQDIRGSKAHAAMLAEKGIISREDADKIVAGLDTVLAEIEGGHFEFRRELEDIHMNVESRLADLIGAAASRLHTARSRTTTRSRPTSSSISATPSIIWTNSSATSSSRSWRARKSMRTRSCRVSRICRRRSP